MSVVSLTAAPIESWKYFLVVLMAAKYFKTYTITLIGIAFNLFVK